MGRKKLRIEKLSSILDRLTTGESYRTIGLKEDTDPSTVFNIARDFPLWGYFKDHPQEDS